VISVATLEMNASPEWQEFESANLRRWWRIADILVFGLWLVVVGVVVQHHEPWADEAQSWLLARDLDLATLWLHELRYNGTPGLWHTILWIAQHWLHASYPALGAIGMICAAAGVAFILWASPFPRLLTYLLVFSYVIVYQYAAVARSYTLLPLLLFAAADAYRNHGRPLLMTVLLILLATVAFHGIILAAALGLCSAIEAFRKWSQMSRIVRRRYLYCGVAMVLAYFFLLAILKPSPDVAVFVNHRNTEPPLLKLEAIVAFAFFDEPIGSAAFLLLAAAWCFRRKRLLSFVLPVSAMLLLYILFYGRPHHHGTAFLAATAGLWIAWPSESEKRQFSREDRLALIGVSALLACMLSLNIWDAAVAVRRDYLYPYSGSADASIFLKRVSAERTTIFGYTYGMSAVQAYFDRNILKNSPTTYYHEGLPLYATALNLGELQVAAPEYVIIYSNDGDITFQTADPPLRSLGYGLVHLSGGDIFYKRTVFDTDMYYIYRRGAIGSER
jgi:hypothetical protein